MDTGVKLTFKKNERLCSTRLIKEIFEKGSVLNSSLFRIIWIKGTGLPSPAQVAISIPKKAFKHAVTRNLIKRRIREAYRVQKNVLYDFLISRNIQIAFIIVYRQNHVPGFGTVKNAISELIVRLNNRLANEGPQC
jgi:ribonuclease P protein component